MESVIARLLNDFESGKLSRRQLVQTLAMVAVGSPVAAALARSAAAAPAPSAAAPWKTVWLDHISYQVSDYKKSMDFYPELMGWTVKPGSDNGRQATLDINGIGGIIIRNGRAAGGARGAVAQGAANPAAAAPPPPPPATGDSSGRGRGGAARPPLTGVINHVSWGIEPWNTEVVKGELERRGLNPSTDTGGGGDIATSKFKSYHVRDPDGWDLQISNQNKEHHEG
jgi:hypothetical protein